VRDPRNDEEALGVVDCVHDPIVAHTNAVVVPAGELRAADRARVLGETVDRPFDAIAPCVKPEA
jgi:hypothetical protein